MSTFLITGCNGLLGQKIAQIAWNGWKIVGVDLHESAVTPGIQYRRLDITAEQAVSQLIEETKPDWVINTASVTNVDRCEAAKELAWQVNVKGAENVALACQKIGSKMIHISSDYVFDGKNGPYSEEDPTNPLSWYGKTKLEGEQITLSRSPENIVLRTMVLYGYEPAVRPNFVTWVINSLQTGKAIRVVADQWGNPTYADNLAEALLKLCVSGAAGLFHFAGGEFLSRWEMATEITQKFDLNAELITPIATSELNQSAPRPLRSGLKTEKIEKLLGIKPLSFQEGLNRMAKQIIASKELP
jgi:dTDP-4-dehydrorhamnose reductase